MKLSTPTDPLPETSSTPTPTPSTPAKADPQSNVPPVSPEAAKRILISLLFPSMIMPLTGSMSRVALPIIRDDFQIQADMTAWVSAVFTLPFMILMPVYGRLGDGVGKRRLILAGIAIFSVGTSITLWAPSLGWLMVGRAIQGVGASGFMPLGMAIITTIFHPSERGKALGNWSSVGPATGFFGPIIAGILATWWGWRGTFAPPLLMGLIAIVIVYRGVPAGLSIIKPNFIRNFDWLGVIWLAAGLTSFVFYLSSRPITGVAPLQDWRLLMLTIVLLLSFWWWERRHRNPFIPFNIFGHPMFSRAAFCASMRMVTMGGLTFLAPLYLVDVYKVSSLQLGVLLIVNSGAMTLMVRFGGGMSDRWGNRWLVMTGLSIQGVVTIIFWLLPADSSIWLPVLALALHGLGAGTMLASLHHAVMKNVPEAEMGTAAGIYSMLRFIGVVIGTSSAGVTLQYFLDRSLPTVEAYQNTFVFYLLFSVLGVLMAFGLPNHNVDQAT
ncbi:MAG: MFS transporter [Chloroflexota bacterium]